MYLPLRTTMAAGAAILLAACSSTAAVSPERDSATNVPFRGCDQVACSGEIEGAPYEILMPEEWNGTLLLYSHGYRPAEPFPPTFDAVERTPVPVPGWDSSDRELGQALLDRGYALAGSAYASNGWAVEDGVRAGEQLHDFFAANVGTPSRVYVWGDSLGGLITQTLAERHPEWVSGAAPLCGVLAGLVPNLDLAFDTAYAVRELIYPEMTLSGYESYGDAVMNWEGAASRLIQGARDQDTDAIARMLTVAAIVDAPKKTYRFDGSSIVSTVSGTVEALLTAMAYSTVGRQEIEERFGGNVSGNEGVDYTARISDEERAAIDAIGGEGATDRYLRLLQEGERTSPDPAARAAAIERGGSPTGAVQDPTITMHTAHDPLVIAQNSTVFRERYADEVERGDVRADLLQLYTVPPAAYSEEEGAPYGAGHCNFTPESRIAVIELLDRWVREGTFPGQAAVEEALGPQSGYDPIYTPGAWPEPGVLAED